MTENNPDQGPRGRPSGARANLRSGGPISKEASFTSQKVCLIKIDQIKNINELTVSFSPEKSMITGIFGPNGCGKSTILHLLACSYHPIRRDATNHKFSHFFLPTSSHSWSGSSFTVRYSQARITNASEPVEEMSDLEFRKAKDRWSPRYDKRPHRDCHYLGIDTCVPRIERENKTTRVHFTGSKPKTEIGVLNAARKILDRDYSGYETLMTKGRRMYIGVKNSVGKYDELSMGAGEQRVFRILEVVHAAEKNSLILIDEIDLLLHEQSLRRLIEHLRDYCLKKRIQLIFTAHRHTLLGISGINIRHIIQTPGKTICADRTTPEALAQLSGENERLFKIFVEDDLAESVVNKIFEQRNARRLASISRFGSIENAFTLAGAASLAKTLRDDDLFVLDGDQFREDGDRERQIKRAITGDDPRMLDIRSRALKSLRQFAMGCGEKPETVIWKSISRLKPHEFLGGAREVVEAASRIVYVDNAHDYLNRIIEETGYERSVGLTRVVDVFCRTETWSYYTKEIAEWLDQRLHAHAIS